MATIRQRKPGVWEVRIFTGRDDKGRPTQTSRTVRGTKRDAQRVAAGLTFTPPARSAGHTVADALDAWIEQKLPTWAAASGRDQRSRARLVVADPIGGTKLARLSVDEVERWHARLRRAGVGEASIRNQHVVLRAALTQAVRWGWLTSNPAALARLTHAKCAPRAAMSPDDVRAVLAAAQAIDPAAELALRLAAVTGARRAELAAMQWSDLDGRRLTIDSAIAVVRRPESPRDPVLLDEATKTANRRTVTLDDDTIARWRSVEAERTGGGPWLFSLDVEPPNPDRIGYWWRRAREVSGIDTAWRLHDLRHGSATFAIGHGHDIRTVAGRLGHANPAMTMRVYAHAVESADQAVAATLASVLDDT